jgi:hypothetical protein
MRRIKLVLAALSVAVASFAAFSGPVLADDLDCRDARGDLIRCDGDLYAPYYNHHDNYDHYYDNDDYFDHYYNPYLFFNPYLFSPYNYYGGFDDDYSYGCEGPVCLID